MMITIEQIRAARALLNWKQSDLAREAAISLASINNIERNIASPRPETLQALERTLRIAGIEFIGQHGVQKIADIFAIEEYHGDNIVKSWHDDFSLCMHGAEDVLYACGIDERDFANYAPDQVLRYEALQLKTQFQEKVLIREGDTFLLTNPAAYRWLSAELLGTMPYMVYKDRVVLAEYHKKRLVIIRNASIADSFRRQFEFLWHLAKPIPTHLDNQLNDPAYRTYMMKTKK